MVIDYYEYYNKLLSMDNNNKRQKNKEQNYKNGI